VIGFGRNDGFWFVCEKKQATAKETGNGKRNRQRQKKQATAKETTTAKEIDNGKGNGKGGALRAGLTVYIPPIAECAMDGAPGLFIAG
jgi:hypothetical protein